MNEIIFNFIEQQTCATICSVDKQGIPYCFSCYYAVTSNKGFLYFKSSLNAYHTSLLSTNQKLSGTILPDILNKWVPKGIQWQGELLHEQYPASSEAANFYHKKFPLALVLEGTVFTIRLDHIKMTNSQLGFGKKSIWKRE